MIAPIPEKPIKNWKDALIRFGIPIGIFAIIVISLLPIMLDESSFTCEIESQCHWLAQMKNSNITEWRN